MRGLRRAFAMLGADPGRLGAIVLSKQGHSPTAWHLRRLMAQRRIDEQPS